MTKIWIASSGSGDDLAEVEEKEDGLEERMMVVAQGSSGKVRDSGWGSWKAKEPRGGRLFYCRCSWKIEIWVVVSGRIDGRYNDDGVDAL